MTFTTSKSVVAAVWLVLALVAAHTCTVNGHVTAHFRNVDDNKVVDLSVDVDKDDAVDAAKYWISSALEYAEAFMSGKHTDDKSTTVDDLSSKGLNFLVIGDWGTKDDAYVAKAMGSAASQTKSQFVIAAGDNFYENGVKDEFDDQFKSKFEKVFTESSLQVPWYAIAGNHDHHQNVTGQIAYSAHSKRWTFPDYWYSKVFQVPSSKTTVEILFIDTIILEAGLTDRVSDSDILLTHSHSDQKVKDAQAQMKWIEDTLKNSKADWLLMVGHYPVYSIGEHGSQSELIQHLKPLLEKYNVAAYLNGHDHGLQHNDAPGVVDYFVIGNGAKSELQEGHGHDLDFNKFYYPRTLLEMYHGYGFGHVSVTDDTLTVDMIDHKGKVLYTTTKSNPRK
eukprot:GFYU01017106.1.p1 GENE.GFYU01017106.1~~GFYU01017106.1.p1  ORF type:complete len:392 (-),score=152.57 GFYU01017106.1:184-1359(-)